MVATLLVPVLTFGLLAVPADMGRGQANDAPAASASHLLLPPLGGENLDLEEFLQKRLEQEKTKRLLQEWLDNPEQKRQLQEWLKNPEQLKQRNPAAAARLEQLQKQLGKMPDVNSRQVQELLRQPWAQELLKREIEKQQKAADTPGGPPREPGPVSLPRGGRPPAPTEDAKQEPAPQPGGRPMFRELPMPKAGGAWPPQPQADGSGAPARPALATPPATDQPRVSSKLLDFANRLKGMDKTLSNSPALSQAIRDLSQAAPAQDARWLDFLREAGDLGERLNSRFSGPGDGSGLIDRLAESLPRVHWRTPDLAQGRSEWVGLPSAPAAGAPAAGGGWRWLWLLLVPVLALLAWRALAVRQARVAAAVAGWRPGAWPVHPARVRTRQELVQAFEHLSLLWLGPDARHRHHRDLGDQLGRQPVPVSKGVPRALAVAPAERQQVAAELATLYEQARYAPPSDVLPESALAAARRDLCSLAGVAAS
jgi:hypothetical protein